MNINPEIRKILERFNIDYTDGVLGLLSIYFDLDDNRRIPELVQKQLNLTKIVVRDYEAPGQIKWEIPLFEGELKTDKTWDWIEEWRGMFGKIRNDAIGSKQDCYSKMKKFFAENPAVRKEDVVKATEMYLTDFATGKTNPKYLQKADYFISKLTKAEGTSQKSSRLDMYLEILEKSKGSESGNVRHLNQVVK